MTLIEFISNSDKTILLDGAMGTQLVESGWEAGGQTNLTHPDTVSDINRRYIECGADVIFTNTFSMNRIYMQSNKLQVDVREVNLAGVRIAKNAANTGQYVLGDIGPTGKLLKPNGNLSEEDAYEAFKEQASILAGAGSDGLIIETMFDLQEALCALRACKDATALPIMVSMTFASAKCGGHTIMGNSATDCVKAFTEAGAYAVGANCGDVDPFQMAEIISNMKEATLLPIIAKPNAGKPEVENGQTIFKLSPSDFALGVRECIQAGVRLVGGCCGTSPAHIKALADLLAR